MRTNIVLDDELVEEALRLTGHKTKKELIHEALKLVVQLKKRKKLSDLKGKIEFFEGFDHKKLRK